MFILVLHLLAYWKWTDQTEKITGGLTYSEEHMEFVDLDLDGDKDMIRLRSHTDSLDAFENITTPTDRRWRQNQELVKGIPYVWEQIYSIGSGDLNADGRDEIVALFDINPFLFPMNVYVNKGTPGKPMWVLDTTFSFFEDEYALGPDFADVDNDGDLDMLGYRKGDFDYFATTWWNRGTPKKPLWEMDTTYLDLELPGPTPPTPVWIDYDRNGIWDVLAAQWAWCDPPPCYGYIFTCKNAGTALSPSWEYESSMELMQVYQMELVDWNQDGVEDLMITGNDDVRSLRLFPGEVDSGKIRFTGPPFIFGGIGCSSYWAADVNGDDLPEIFCSRTEYEMNPWGGEGSYFTHNECYSAYNESGTLWKLDAAYRTYEAHGDCMFFNSFNWYVDFGNDGLVDHVNSCISRRDTNSKYASLNILYRNKGTKTEPLWVLDSTALKDLPPLFPACFVDADGDGDKDVIGVPAGDSSPKGFLNMVSDKHPSYAEYPALVAGLENVKPSYISAGDITDNDLNLSDLVVGVKGGNITAFFNTGQTNPRWTRHDEVFAGLGISGNPCLADMDADKKLDLFVSVNNSLRYYHNESTGGVDETPSTPSGLSVTCLGRSVELSFNADSWTATNTKLFLYDASGRRVRLMEPVIESGNLLFRISPGEEGPGQGVYFYRIVSGGDSYKGKVVLF